MNKKYGVLLAVSSLPGNHGIGDFGENAFSFINWLTKKHYSYWQVLPLNPLGPGYSPYMSCCSNAIEYRYISLDLLVKDGLLDFVPTHHRSATKVDYYGVGEFKKPYLYKAYKKFISLYSETLHKFKVRQPWVYKYATFEVFKWHNDNKIWTEWPIEFKNYFINHNNPPKSMLDEINFVIFMQYIALKQWKSILHYANRKGVSIICDMPFYVGFDGVECWCNRNQFSINDKDELYEVGGVGPDAFSEDGQLWGSPIYNFEEMKKDNYKLLIDRIGYLSSLCNILRIDHFRAFDTYYVIPSNETTAKNGTWKLGPREDFFDELYKRYPKINLIAEDLGELRPEVYELRDKYNLPGMYIFEFMAFTDDKSYSSKIVYPGTHDNETLFSWLNNLSIQQKKNIAKKVHAPHYNNLFKATMKYIHDLPSILTIFSMQDILKLNNKCRLNTPGTIGSPNWEWKLKDLNI